MHKLNNTENSINIENYFLIIVFSSRCYKNETYLLDCS